jgi:hypothetical protein
MIAEMHSAGIPVDTIVRAVAKLEEAMAARAVSTGSPVDTSTIDKRRAWDRERKRRQRASAKSTGHPPESTGNPPDATCILIREKKEDAFEVEVKEKKESKKRDARARGTRIPPDFSIDDDDRAFAIGLGIPPDMIESETAAFIDYWTDLPGAKGLKLTWKGTWRNRMRDIRKFHLNKSRAFNGQRAANPRKTGHDAILAAAHRAAREEFGDGEMAGPTGEAEFSFGDGAFGSRSAGSQRSADRAETDHHGREPFAGPVLEGEVISPDEASAGLSNGWRRH